jgi:hypothetical protein
MADPTNPLREVVNRSGIPFQLAVENSIGTVGAKHGVKVIGREVPWTSGFVDVVARRDQFLFAFECKRVDNKPWVFVISDDRRENQTRCRLEWFNSEAPLPRLPSPEHSRVFCSEWAVQEESPESEFCIVPRGTPIVSLEAVCRDLLSGCHALLSDEEITYGWPYFVVVVPVIITTAKLHTCGLDPTAVPHATGKLDVSNGRFSSVDLVRFRKSLVTARSNSYDLSKMVLEDWAADRERTVFVLTPSALERFLAGFQSVSVMGGMNGRPKEFIHPPTVEES